RRGRLRRPGSGPPPWAQDQEQGEPGKETPEGSANAQQGDARGGGYEGRDRGKPRMFFSQRGPQCGGEARQQSEARDGFDQDRRRRGDEARGQRRAEAQEQVS